ncbi:MAG: 2OG-Fe(II) oxygenase [Alphaproteobacteria bacterium]
MSFLNLDKFAATPLVREPFDFIVVPGFLRAEALPALNEAFPRIDRPGSFPMSVLNYGEAFGALVDELRGPPVRTAFAGKFGVDLTGRPAMVTVRGRCREKDGRIHTDTKSKIITVLIYMNPGCEGPGGRLRLLRSADDIDDVVAEAPPEEGTLIAFRRSENSFHGHEPFVGERRVIQLNWVTDRKVVEREQARHRLSARLKGLNPLARLA